MIKKYVSNRNMLLLSIFLILPVQGMSQISKLNSDILAQNKQNIESSTVEFPVSATIELSSKTSVLNNTFYAVAEGNGRIIQVENDNSQLIITSITQDGSQIWKRIIETSADITQVKTSRNSKRTVIYSYSHESGRIEAVIDSVGNENSGPRSFLELSPSGNFFYNKSSLLIYDENLDKVSTEDLLNLIHPGKDKSNFRYSINFFDNDIIRVGFTEYEKNIVENKGNRRANIRNSEVSESRVSFIDLKKLTEIYQMEIYLKDELYKFLLDMIYMDESILYVYRERDPETGKYIDDNVQFDLLNISTNSSVKVAEGSYINIGKVENDNLFYITKKDRQGGIELITVSPEGSTESYHIKGYRRIESIFKKDNMFVLNSNVDINRNIIHMEYYNLNGGIEEEITGWFNTETKGVIPISENEIVVKK